VAKSVDFLPLAVKSYSLERDGWYGDVVCGLDTAGWVEVYRR
jgi:hypothetical protein